MFARVHTHRHEQTERRQLTQQCGQRPHVLLHQRVDLLFGEAADAVAVHLPAHHAAVQVAQQPLEGVAERAAHRQQLLRLLQVVHPLAVRYRPGRGHTHRCGAYFFILELDVYTDLCSAPDVYRLRGGND